ncbi:MAG: 16S rRNA (cytidine(1402)-2'-O)-methyltransferase [Proteobacteria bacterium]|uniref:Ribosomal RNA small subunit methyltransferase I n=1 Tax=Candidatus Avisuccinivibrio stercorigallinarum TaxID=2840704 RepID=A0A9D9D7T3_9GAMM|nr:16S rRNA (cytidine(1402)-2'-O)-methyltransferase [Candidatus Avisuccinivibrio stercorigallinarum]
MLKPALYIAATPIGNLQDVTLRVIETLQQVTMIAAEDTRHSQIFLQSINVTGKKMLSCHNYNEAERAELIAAEIEAGGSVALISDAGTPLISDPGFKVVKALAARGIDIIALPGPCAAITALCVSGLPTDKFFFYGFLPVKEKECMEVLGSFKDSQVSTIFYESPRRIAETLSRMAKIYPEREAALCRELTKTFEIIYRGSVAELLQTAQSDENLSRGELVLILGGAGHQSEPGLTPKAEAALSQMLAEGMSVKGASRVLSDLLGLKSKEVYARALELKNAR